MEGKENPEDSPRGQARGYRFDLLTKIQRELGMNRRAWFLNPEGGYTVDFGRPLPCEDDPCDFPKAECYDVNGEFRIKVYIDDTQLGVIIDALNIGILEYDCQIRKLFEYYTEDQEALRIAEVVTELLTSIEVERAVENELYFDLVQRLPAIQNDK